MPDMKIPLLIFIFSLFFCLSQIYIFLLKNTLYVLSFYIYPHLITVINAPISSARALYTLIKINEFILFFNLFTLSLQ